MQSVESPQHCRLSICTSMLGRSSPVRQSFDLTAPFCKSSLAQSTFDQTGHHQWADLSICSYFGWLLQILNLRRVLLFCWLGSHTIGGRWGNELNRLCWEETKGSVMAQSESNMPFFKKWELAMQKLLGVELQKVISPVKSSQIQSNPVKSNQIQSNQIKSNQGLAVLDDICDQDSVRSPQPHLWGDLLQREQRAAAPSSPYDCRRAAWGGVALLFFDETLFLLAKERIFLNSVLWQVPWVLLAFFLYVMLPYKRVSLFFDVQSDAQNISWGKRFKIARILLGALFNILTVTQDNSQNAWNWWQSVSTSQDVNYSTLKFEFSRSKVGQERKADVLSTFSTSSSFSFPWALALSWCGWLCSWQEWTPTGWTSTASQIWQRLILAQQYQEQSSMEAGSQLVSNILTPLNSSLYSSRPSNTMTNDKKRNSI